MDTAHSIFHAHVLSTAIVRRRSPRLRALVWGALATSAVWMTLA